MQYYGESKISHYEVGRLRQLCVAIISSDKPWPQESRIDFGKKSKAPKVDHTRSSAQLGGNVVDEDANDAPNQVSPSPRHNPLQRPRRRQCTR